MNHEKVLIIILAETRAYEFTFPLFKTNLLIPYKADLALCVAKNQRENANNPFYSQAKYIWTCDEPEDWGTAFDEAQTSLNYQGNWRQLLAIKDQWLGGIKGPGAHPGSAGILLYFRWFLKQCLVNAKLLDRYDRFVITRSDFIHPVPHAPLRLLCPTKVWIPYGEGYGGYTDRHIILHRNHVLDALSVTDPIFAAPERLFDKMKHCQNWNLERYIKFIFGEIGLDKLIRTYPYTMYTVRGLTGHTRWRAGTYDQTLGYCIKYQGEFRRAKLAAKFISREEHWNSFIMWFLMMVIDVKDTIDKLRNKLYSIGKVCFR